MPLKTIRAIPAIALTMWALLFIMETDAKSVEMIGVAPSYFEVEVPKNTSTFFRVNVFNKGPKVMKIETTFQDFTLDSDGHVIFLEAEQKRRSWSASSWLKTQKKKFVLAPNTHKEILVTILQPAKAEAGTHRALVTFSTFTGSSEKPGSPEVLIKSSVSSLVLIDVGGDTTTKPSIALKIPKFNFTTPRASLALSNGGNTHYFAEGDMHFVNSKGKIQKTMSLKRKLPGALVLPNARRIFEFAWFDAPYFGAYSAKAIVKITGNRELVAEKHFYIIRWQLLAAIGMFLAALTFIYFVFSRFQLVKKEPDDKQSI